jgi:hypothetical protein
VPNASSIIREIFLAEFSLSKLIVNLGLMCSGYSGFKSNDVRKNNVAFKILWICHAFVVASFVIMNCKSWDHTKIFLYLTFTTYFQQIIVIAWCPRTPSLSPLLCSFSASTDWLTRWMWLITTRDEFSVPLWAMLSPPSEVLSAWNEAIIKQQQTTAHRNNRRTGASPGRDSF